jgi:hypothetical protein
VVRFHLVLTCHLQPISASSPVSLDIESVPLESQKPEMDDSKALVSVRAALQSIAEGQKGRGAAAPGVNVSNDFRVKASRSQPPSIHAASESSHSTAQLTPKDLRSDKIGANSRILATLRICLV